MRKDITIDAQPRESRGKNEARRLRAAGSTPGVLYGVTETSVALAVNPKEVGKILHSRTGQNTIFNLAVQGGETTPVMISAWQSDPVKDTLLHIDLKRIDLTKRIRVGVPVHTKGEPAGVKLQGGLHELITREIEIECLPDDIPEQFVVDVSALMIGQSIRASDIPLTGSMTLVSNPESVISHIVTIRAEEVAAPVEGAAPAATSEPEVIKKGKKDEEGADAAKPGAKDAKPAAGKPAAAKPAKDAKKK
jgi:large subunit ribosomal protein L25